MRTTEDIREKLEKAASQSGRSLAQEVEYRLEQSFRDENMIENILTFYFGSKDTIELLKKIAPLIEHQMGHSGKSWSNDKSTRVGILRHIFGLFFALDDEEGSARTQAAWEAMVEHDQNAWKNPSPPPERLASSHQNADEQESGGDAPVQRVRSTKTGKTNVRKAR
jgi:hypothetical protein